MVVKSRKVIFQHFDPIVKLWVLMNVVEDTPLQQFFWGSLSLFDPTFSGIAWIDKLHNCEEFISFTMVAMETEKSHVFNYQSSCC